VAITFFIVCIGWVFFRAETLPQAMTYLASLFGLAHVPSSVAGVQAAIYTPLHIIVFLIAVLVVWKGQEAWIYTRTLTIRRAATIMGLLAVAIVLMWSQNENYFIYFRF